jgi:hypothetical protein
MTLHPTSRKTCVTSNRVPRHDTNKIYVTSHVSQSFTMGIRDLDRTFPVRSVSKARNSSSGISPFSCNLVRSYVRFTRQQQQASERAENTHLHRSLNSNSTPDQTPDVFDHRTSFLHPTPKPRDTEELSGFEERGCFHYVYGS